MSNATQRRKPAGPDKVTGKHTLGALNAAISRIPSQQSAISTKQTKVEPENARVHLEMQEVLGKDEQITFDTLTVALIKTLDNTDLPDDVLRSRIRALAYVGQQYTREFVAQQTINFILEQAYQAQKTEREKIQAEFQEVRQNLDRERASIVEETLRLLNERTAWKKTMEDLASLKETVTKIQGAFVEKIGEAITMMSEVKATMETAVDEMRMDKYFASTDLCARNAGQNGGNLGYTNETGKIFSYAGAAAAGAPQPTPAPQPQRELHQQQLLDRIRGSEEKHDRQLMLDSEDLGGIKGHNLTEKATKEQQSC
ncbi:hypothetical protein OPQ81_011950 [Rhizoctonia solani]|nr:hypothetical protein OPQ81_011950 [Rhizoctonia solani]